MIFSENRCPPTGQARGRAFRDHAPANGNGLRDRHPTADCYFNAIYDACKSMKDLRTESWFNTSTRVFPIRAGAGDTLIPGDSIVAILDSAPHLPPEIMAPAIIAAKGMGTTAPQRQESPEENIGAFVSHLAGSVLQDRMHEIGRASCRERV